MLVKYLNTNQPLVLFFLPVFTAALWIPFVLEPVKPELYISSQYVFLFRFDLLLTDMPGLIAGGCCTVLTAIFVNAVIINSELSNRPTYIYAFTYATLESALRTDGYLHSWQISILATVGALWILLKIFNQRHVLDLGFEAGILCGLAGLFYPPSLVFFLIIPVFLQVFRPFNWREWLFPFIGVGIIILFYITWCMFFNKPLYRLYVVQQFDYKAWFNSWPYILIALGVFLFLSILNFIGHTLRAVMHARKQRLLVFYLFIVIVCVLSMLNIAGLTHTGYSLAAVPASLFAGHYLANIRRKWMGEILFLAVVALFILRNYV